VKRKNQKDIVSFKFNPEKLITLGMEMGFEFKLFIGVFILPSWMNSNLISYNFYKNISRIKSMKYFYHSFFIVYKKQ